MDGLTNTSSESEDYDSGPIGNGLVLFPSDDSDQQRESTVDDLAYDGTDCLHFRGKKYEDLDGVELKTADKVDQFYAYYSLAIGFSVRKQKSNKNSEAKIRRIILVCSRKGQRQSQAPKKQKYSTEKNNDLERDGCQKQFKKAYSCLCRARLSVLLCKSSDVYYAANFVTEHNHNLVRREHVCFLRTHRSVMDHDIAQETINTEAFSAVFY